MGKRGRLTLSAAIKNPPDFSFLAVGNVKRAVRRLRHAIRRYDVFWWVDAFLDAALVPTGSAARDDVPALEMDPALLHAANDAEELPDNPLSDTPTTRRPHANLLN